VAPAALLCLWASTADAQIYALRQPDGTLVLSDKPLGPGAQTYTVRGSNDLRTTATANAVPVGSGLGRSSSWDDVIEEHASANRVRPELVRAVIQVESGFNPRARSNKGAMGLMQLMPDTASDLGVRNAFDPVQNIRGGVAYLRQLLDKFGGSEELALAAYNAGPGAVSRYGDAIPPYRETRQYVEKVRSRTSIGSMGATRIYKIIKVINGREVPFYSGVKPSSGRYEVIVKQPTIVVGGNDESNE
jgi:hypothetical protein